MAWLLLASAPAGAQTTTDHDANDNRLIDVDSLAKLNAIRYDRNGDGLQGSESAPNWTIYTAAFANPDSSQCPSGCQGYELLGDLNFDSDNSGSVDGSDAFGGNWTPIATYSAIFDGNGHALSNLTLDRTGSQAGLFAALGGSGLIRNLGLIDPSISGGGNTAAEVGGIVGRNNGVISSSYVSGGTVAAKGGVNSPRLGGLAGYTGSGGNVNQGSIRASYSTAAVSTAAGNAFVGGLLGQLEGEVGSSTHGTIHASYAAAASISVTGGLSPQIGGLVGRARGANAAVYNSYCDITVRPGDCVGRVWQSSPAKDQANQGKTTTQLQQPTGYDGIYSGWNIDVGGAGGSDPWYFGTASDYPRPYYLRPAAPPRVQPPARSGGQPYNWRTDHPEIYRNARTGITATCAVETTGEGDEAISTATITFALADYDRPITLALSLWDRTHFRSLQSLGLNMPQLQRDGQTATVEVVTDPAKTRFRLDGQYGLNLVLGYADCHTDDS